MDNRNNFVSADPGGQHAIQSQTEEQLLQFQKITLQEMEAVQLQDRMDTKLVFHRDRLPFILARLKDDYLVFEINNCRLSPYQTLYFDDDRWKLYLMHHNEKMNRFKLRYRTYVNSDLSFFEVKYKNNKGRTQKERIKVPCVSNEIDESAAKLMKEITNLEPAGFFPKLWVNYSRITFVSKLKTERVTVDLHLCYKNNDSRIALDDLVIAEVKQGRASSGSPFLRLMKEQGIRAGAISKYCLGVVMLHDNVKKNNFKIKMMTVNKILNTPKD